MDLILGNLKNLNNANFYGTVFGVYKFKFCINLRQELNIGKLKF